MLLKRNTQKLLNLSREFRKHYPRGSASKQRNRTADSLRRFRNSDRVRSYLASTTSAVMRARQGNQPLMKKSG